MKKILKLYIFGCSPCIAVTHIMDKMDLTWIEVESIDITNSMQEAIKKYSLLNVPTLIFFEDGKEYDRLDWTISEKQILNLIKK